MEFEEYVAQRYADVNIIKVDFNDIGFEDLQEYHKLYDYIESRFVDGAKNFVLIDEVQMCKEFEKAINSLHNSGKYDIYITGSNAFLLSSDLATLFTGRTYSIEVFPFSFREYLEYYDGLEDRYEVFDKYLMDGGLAGSYIYDEMTEKRRYAAEIYETMILRDIEQKNRVKNTTVLRKVGDYLLDNISRLTTGRTITNVLNGDGQEVDNKTVGSYLEYLERAFVFYKVKRYDVQGKKYLYSQDKYYICDLLLKYARLGTKNVNYGSAYENLVAIELLRRGYEIYVGVLGNKEVDFVAKRGDEKFYVQVSYDIEKVETFEREVGSLINIKDAYPKILVARTKQPEQVYEGVRIFDIADWLVGGNGRGMI